MCEMVDPIYLKVGTSGVCISNKTIKEKTAREVMRKI